MTFYLSAIVNIALNVILPGTIRKLGCGFLFPSIVTMKISQEDAIFIKHLYLSKQYGAQRLFSEFPD